MVVATFPQNTTIVFHDSCCKISNICILKGILYTMLIIGAYCTKYIDIEILLHSDKDSD